MTTRKRTRRSRAGFTGCKAYELLTGKIATALVAYSGYAHSGATVGQIEDVEFDRDAAEYDWEEYGEALTKFWKSGDYTMRETLAPHGIDVKVAPWLWECGGPGKLPWAAKFLAPKTKRKAVTKRAASK